MAGKAGRDLATERPATRVTRQFDSGKTKEGPSSAEDQSSRIGGWIRVPVMKAVLAARARAAIHRAEGLRHDDSKHRTGTIAGYAIHTLWTPGRAILVAAAGVITLIRAHRRKPTDGDGRASRPEFSTTFALDTYRTRDSSILLSPAVPKNKQP